MDSDEISKFISKINRQTDFVRWKSIVVVSATHTNWDNYDEQIWSKKDVTFVGWTKKDQTTEQKLWTTCATNEKHVQMYRKQQEKQLVNKMTNLNEALIKICSH